MSNAVLNHIKFINVTSQYHADQTALEKLENAHSELYFLKGEFFNFLFLMWLKINCPKPSWAVFKCIEYILILIIILEYSDVFYNELIHYFLNLFDYFKSHAFNTCRCPSLNLR